MNIVWKIEKVRLLCYMDCLEFSLEKMSHAIIFYIEIVGIPCSEFTHKFGNTTVNFLPQHQMIMIRHKTKTKNFYKQLSRLPFNLLKSDFRRLNIVIKGLRWDNIIEFKKVMHRSKIILIIHKNLPFLHSTAIYMIYFACDKLWSFHVFAY